MHQFLSHCALAEAGHKSSNVELAALYLLIAVLSLVGLAQTFAKAGQPRWAVLIPLYNVIVLLRIAQRPIWWLLLLFVPGVNVIVAVVISLDIARYFGKGAGFGLGLAVLGFVFYPVLGLGNATYIPLASDAAGSFVLGNSASLKRRLKELGLSIEDNVHGSGVAVGIGRSARISDGHVAELIPLGLHELYLSRTDISDESVAALATMPQLRVLDLSHTKISQDGIKQLRASLPQTKIMG